MLKYYQFFMMMGCLTLLIGVTEVVLISTDNMVENQSELIERRSDGGLSENDYDEMSDDVNDRFMVESSESLGLVNNLVINSEMALNRISRAFHLGIETDVGSRYFGSAVESFEGSVNKSYNKTDFENIDLDFLRSLEEKNKFYPFEIVEINAVEENLDYIVTIKAIYRAPASIKDPSVKVRFSGGSVGSFVDEKVLYNEYYEPYDIIEFNVTPSKTNKPVDFEVVEFGCVYANENVF